MFWLCKHKNDVQSTHLKFENHFTNCAVLFLLNFISGKYIFSTCELGYLTQKNISFAFLRCIGVNVAECIVVKELTALNCWKYFDCCFIQFILSIKIFCFGLRILTGSINKKAKNIEQIWIEMKIEKRNGEENQNETGMISKVDCERNENDST